MATLKIVCRGARVQSTDLLGGNRSSASDQGNSNRGGKKCEIPSIYICRKS